RPVPEKGQCDFGRALSYQRPSSPACREWYPLLVRSGSDQPSRHTAPSAYDTFGVRWPTHREHPFPGKTNEKTRLAIGQIPLLDAATSAHSDVRTPAPDSLAKSG